ncbi:MAG: proton extrusion protein PcxA [Rivularia sp. (in: Bacteria)]|nr:proton extrusion protein PcxA [Rivularia sp. MS3]
MVKNTLDNCKGDIFGNFLKISHHVYQWSINTPTRALNRAYLAALSIKSIEADYATSQDGEVKDNAIIVKYLQSDIDKYLAIIKVNLAEFKVSRFLLNDRHQSYWSKILLIEEVLKKYHIKTETIEPVIAPNVEELARTPQQVNKYDKYARLKDDFTQVKPVSDKTGVLPRSLNRTFNKIQTDLKGDGEAEIIANFRRDRRVTQAAIRCFLLLIIIPVITQQISKQFFILPLVEQYREQHHAAVFINTEMKEEAFRELEDFEAELKFENLISLAPVISTVENELELKEKAQEIALEFSHKSSTAISNVCADLLGLLAFIIVALTNKRGIAAIKSFLDNLMYGLSDSAKAFLIILFTDIFVGFHSPHGWEVILEGIANHLGIEANHSAIFLFIATFPVILDTILKYWIFRYLNRISPSAVATLKNMNE